MFNFAPHKEKFFDSSLSREMGVIERLIGVGSFRQQIIDGKPESEIRASWEPGLSEYKKNESEIFAVSLRQTSFSVENDLQRTDSKTFEL